MSLRAKLPQVPAVSRRGIPPAWWRRVKALVDAGFGRQVVIGTDIGTRSALKAYGGRGFAWLIEQFLPRLRALGLDDEQLKAITTDNVARALTVGKG